MKSYKELPNLLMITGMFLIIFSIAVIMSAISSIIINHFTNNGLLFTLTFFALISLIQIFINRKKWVRVWEICARHILENLPEKMIKIETEVNDGIITNIEAINKKHELQAESDFFGSIDGYSKLFSGFAKILTIILILISIIFVSLYKFAIISIDLIEIMNIIIFGIFSQLILILTTNYVYKLILKKRNKITA